MKLSEIKKNLSTLNEVSFVQPNGELVPVHFHITEVGLTTKHFIDCGGTVRDEKVANFQLWEANDFDHRLAPQKLLGIIELSEKVLNMPDLEVEVEYQTNTIGRYGLDFKDQKFVLISKQTDCLAKDNCGVSESKQKIQLVELGNENESCCAPGKGCC